MQWTEAGCDATNRSADVEITLRNRGTDAYKPELYGEKIIVNRHFNKDGSSLYKIKSKDGRVISQKKDDLCRILDKFNIQVDNPVTILNQDMSRNLLNTKSANDRYKFFIQAIQATPLHVGQTWKDYSMANEQKLVTMEMIERKMKPLPKLEKEVLSWEQKYKSLTAIDDLKGKIELLKKEMAWAFVIETEKAVIDKASQMHSDRINTRRSPTNLESQINQIIKQIHVEERQRGDPDEIAREYKEKRDSFFVIKKEVKQLKLLCERLDMVASKKLQQFKEFRRMVAVRAKYFFNIRLSNRQYSGKMMFNHQKETLDMNVEPTKTGQGEGAKDMKSLSGGERSFSTVCFILALWDAMEAPFRCLDEFDAFMDTVNRRITMDMLLDTAKSQPDKQFIFCSPHIPPSMSCGQLGISGGTGVKIFHMPDPDRGQGQSVLPFRPANETQDDAEEN